MGTMGSPGSDKGDGVEFARFVFSLALVKFALLVPQGNFTGPR